MSLSWSVHGMALLAALFWGIGPGLSKRGMEHGGTSVQAAMTAIVTSFALVWGWLLVTRGTAPMAGVGWRGAVIFFAGGIVGTALGRIAVYTGIDRIGSSINTAITHSRSLVSTTLAFLFLGEAVGLTTVGGILVLVAGLMILSVSRGGDIRGWDLRDLVFPLVAASAYGSGAVIRRFGMTTTAASATQAVALNEVAALVGLGGFFVLAYRGSFVEKFRSTRAAYGYFVAGGVCSALGLIALFTALEEGRVAVVDPLSSAAPLVALVFAAVFLRDVERVTRGVIAGAVLVIAGVTLITIG